MRRWTDDDERVRARTEQLLGHLVPWLIVASLLTLMALAADPIATR